MARMARQTRLSGLSASDPASSRRSGSVKGNKARHGIASDAARSAARTAWSTESRCTSGIDSTGARTCVPSTMNRGQIRSSAVSTFSRIMRRDHSLLRLRRGRPTRSSRSPFTSAGANRLRSRGRPNLIAMKGLLTPLCFIPSQAGLPLAAMPRFSANGQPLTRCQSARIDRAVERI